MILPTHKIQVHQKDPSQKSEKLKIKFDNNLTEDTVSGHAQHFTMHYAKIAQAVMPSRVLRNALPTCMFPGTWVAARISQNLYNESSNISSYRSVGTLSSFAKVFERSLYSLLLSYGT
ncbi:hypothetical protein Trydic_g11222 [Trypoxylus dichotomus]